MVKSFDLSGKVVLVTGGYGHLGRAISESLAFHKAKVFVLGRNQEKFESVFRSVRRTYPDLRFVQCDVSSTASITQAFSEVLAEHKVIDVLINNAMSYRGLSAESMSDDDWKNGIEGTLDSVYKCIKAVIPYFILEKKGKIINVSSMYGMVSPDFSIYDDSPGVFSPPHYGAAKAGVIHLTKYYAAYLGKHGITVNCVSPGPFPSAKVQKDEEFINVLSKRTCVGRIGAPEDLAGSFVFLASDASNFVTGHNLVVDGGWTVR